MRFLMSKFKLLILLFASILIGCDLYDKASVVVDDVLNSCPDAVNVLESSFESKKVIFVGINDHATINTALFFSKENLQKLHDCGMRYILCEGGLSSKNLYDDSDLVQQEVELFYPWESVEAQYYENTVFQNVHSINRNLAQDEKIKVVGLEGRRQNFTIGDDESRIYNYRDEYMFNVAREYIDGSKEDERILILCGSAHGYTDGVRRFNPQGNSEYEWITLGSRLKREYGDAFLSLSYIAVDSATRDSVFYGQLKKSDSWNTTNIVGKFVTLQDAEEINGAIPIFFDGNYPLYDGFIMDKHAEYGVKYCYKLDAPAVLERVIVQTEELYQSLSQIAETEGGFDYDNPDIAYKIEFFCRNVYYLKLYFGKDFDYSFWNPSTRLEDALAALRKLSVAAKTVSEEAAKEFQTLIRCMYYLQYGATKEDISFYYEHGTDALELARSLIPHEIWPLYWYTVMNFRLGNYGDTLRYADLFLGEELSRSTFCLPDVLELAIESCTETGRDSSKYAKMLEGLSNELGIDVDKVHLFLQGAWQLVQHSSLP